MTARDSGLSLPENVVTNDLLSFLRQMPFLRQMAEPELTVLLQAVERVPLVTGQVVLREGETSRALYFVYDGGVEVLKSNEENQPDDPGAFAIHQIGRGSVFGEMSFVDGDPASATIRASQPSELLKLDREALAGLSTQSGLPVLDRLNGAVSLAVTRRLRVLSRTHVEALQREIQEVKLRNAFERFFMATMVLFAIASLVQKLIQGNLSPLAHMGYSWGFLLLSVAPMAWFARQQRRPPRDFGLTLVNGKRAMAESLAVTLLVLVLGGALLWSQLPPGQPLVNWGSVAKYNRLEFLVFLAGYPLHSLLQEFIGRGVIQSSLAHFLPKSHWFLPILLTSLLFGIYHLYVSVAFALLTVAVSMLFGWLYQRHRTLVGVTTLHAAIGVASVALGLN